MSSFLPVPLRRHTMVGVDIGASSVKVVEISVARGGRALTLHRCASELLEKGAVVNGSLVQVDAVARALTSALRKGRIHSHAATLALPLSLTECSTLSLPDNLSHDELGVEVEHEAQRLYPPSEQINYDHGIIAHHREAKSVTVQVVAARRDAVEERVFAAELAGLKPVAIEVEETSIHRLMASRARAASNGHAHAGIEVLVHLGATRSAALFYQGAMPVHREQINSTGDQLTESCARAFRQDMRKAEIHKRKNTLPREWRAQILKPSLELLAMEIQSAISSFAARSTLGAVERILLCGGHASLPGLDEAVQAQSRIATEIFDPFAHMTIGRHVNPRYFERDLPAQVIGAGLGLRGGAQP
ncbi:type IV pilus assembly protein PilM [Cupriavidus plantarum]|uniref:Type IV pilus assembly protein PilM n=1 Tax=Cupriavidus plantarum TaxID=942865 RepID=A0A316EUW4_9BURK|nr:type IV pilus assembly protein PilM [Cupriavidus plantarum]NYI00974.1 type IV pilus assembly protein PilM [Cupriavidus plantarum]PWK35385.1 type IV pilus assembly protein PilM [Cupriavidus plantarum]REE93839.1 type IV pilus assembly protein PilM [Cupriavidus plantarum]RLK39250.1 type IV pilus assembly protein PilM [Cupriavidus plantarum]CAG2134484.1 hypothetical protein LMG26296_02035 [Cupriavidus plantarum]